MAVPFHPPGTFEPLAVMFEAALTDRVTLETFSGPLIHPDTLEELPGNWVAEAEQRGKWIPVGTEVAAQAAATGVVISGILELSRDSIGAVIGQRAVVRGTNRRGAYQRLVEVTRDLTAHAAATHRRYGTADVDLSR